MTDTPMPAGWYHGDGDPAGTHRYWDGSAWQGEPQLAGMSEAPNEPSAVPNSHYGPLDWFKEPFKKYADFSGRARRAEYWWFALGNAVITVGLAFFSALFDSPIGIIPFFVYFLATIIPSIAVATRRLHDSGNSGWVYLLVLIPVISLILVVFMFLDSERTANKWGPSPKYG